MTEDFDKSSADPTISTHTPLAGRDANAFFPLEAYIKFLLTRPSRDVTEWNRAELETAVISTHTPLAGRDTNIIRKNTSIGISTHTPLAGRDKEKAETAEETLNFYSHAPRGT